VDIEAAAGPKAADTGVILHQPLSLHIFRKKRVFCQKMNGPAVCPCQKSENAPTWRPQNTNFWARFWRVSRLIFRVCILFFQLKSQSPSKRNTII